ncbi:MAG: hypothetical protein ACREUU_02790 [Gammaproteobacteria bacterium]
MKRRQFIQTSTALLAAPAAMAEVMRGAEPSAPPGASQAAGATERSGPGPAKNVIELRCETGGEEWFRCLVRPDVIAPQKTYWLADRRTDTWTGTTVNRNAKVMPENILWPIAVEYLAPTGVSAGGRHPYIELDAIPQAEGHITYVPCDKFTVGSIVSHTSGNHQKDWDYMVGKLREILTGAGLSVRSSNWEKVTAVANFCIQTRREKPNMGGRYVFPADFCLKGSYCVGAANTLVGFCSVMGIPARTIGYGGHTCAEALLDGKWRWVENWADIVAQTKEKGPVYSVSFLEMINDPASHMTKEEYTKKFREFSCVFDESRSAWLAFNHEGYSNWIFTGGGSYRNANLPWAQSGLGSLREISALYPELSRIRYKCDQTPRVWLTPFRMPDPRGADWQIVGQDDGIRQEFHLSSLHNVKAVTSALVVPNPDGWKKCKVPEDGAKWFYRINGRKVTVKELGGWNIKSNYQGLGITCLELVLKPEWLVTSAP